MTSEKMKPLELPGGGQIGVYDHPAEPLEWTHPLAKDLDLAWEPGLDTTLAKAVLEPVLDGAEQKLLSLEAAARTTAEKVGDLIEEKRQGYVNDHLAEPLGGLLDWLEAQLIEIDRRRQRVEAVLDLASRPAPPPKEAGPALTSELQRQEARAFFRNLSGQDRARFLDQASPEILDALAADQLDPTTADRARRLKRERVISEHLWLDTWRADMEALSRAAQGLTANVFRAIRKRLADQGLQPDIGPERRKKWGTNGFLQEGA